jgi:hypothetical protein
MTPKDFTYWLQGFFELSNEDVTLSHRQLKIIKDHLNLVFDKETPDRSTEEGGDEELPTDIFSPPNRWKETTFAVGGAGLGERGSC